MYISKTIQLLSLTAMIIGMTACNNGKTTVNGEETSNIDTITEADSKQGLTPTDTITPVVATNETNKKVEAAVEKTVVKTDLSGKGTIIQKGEIWVIRTTGTGGTDYVPSNLDDKFKIDGKVVTFEANLLPIPKGVRMAGNPITLVSIK